jgi:putative serine protease PepD
VVRESHDPEGPQMLLRKSTATLLAGAVLGGAVGGGAVAAIADGGSTSTTTTVAAAPAATGSTTSSSTSNAAAIYRRVSGSVVQITAVSTGTGGGGNTPFGGGGQSAGEATGTGFVVDSSGLIVTNEHVVDGASKLTVTLQNGDRLKATLVGKDNSSDLAVLKVDPGSHTLTALQLSDDTNLSVGDTTYAIGSPYGLQGTLTTGVISALHRQITAPNGFSISNAIQTDAELNPGNSGGPLLNAAGEVIGVNAQVYGASQTASGETSGGTGLGFAIPSSTVKRVVAALREGSTVQHAYLGVGISDGNGGATLGTVVAGGPADDAGLKAGDVVTQVGATKIGDGDQLSAAISKLEPGEKVTLKVTRDGSTHDVEVTLGTQPAQATS